ncbi:MAG: hypothetical protein RO469_13390 [Thermincola sp.]|nr:hypothetical protein [Thermincola sp.]MDT3704343.1 hypothetical protein [Thermincola sp.]
MTVYGSLLGRHRHESCCKAESSKPESPRMSEDGEDRREVSLAEIAKREAASL